jgi:hypothetical protein
MRSDAVQGDRMSATCPRCGGPAIDLFTGVACDACDPTPPAAMQMRSAACPLCGNPASILTLDFRGNQIPVTMCPCTAINGGVFVVPGRATIRSEHPGYNGYARLDGDDERLSAEMRAIKWKPVGF